MSSSSASKSRRSSACSTAPGEFTACVSKPSFLRRRRSASMTSGWSSAIRTDAAWCWTSCAGLVMSPKLGQRPCYGTSGTAVSGGVQPAVLQLDDPVAVAGVLLRVRHLDDRGAFLVQLREELHDLPRLRRVEVAGGLVGEDQSRLRDHRARDAHELLLSAGELTREEVLLRDHAEAIEGVGHDRLAFGLLHVPVGERDVEVFGDGEVVDEMILLEDEADMRLVESHALLRVHPMHRLAGEPVFAAPAVIQHAEHCQQRRLSGARGSHDGDELARVDDEGDETQDVHLAW